MPDAVEFIRGYYGKVPVRGDFVHAGFPRDFNDPWHDWQSRVIAGSQMIMGEAWLSTPMPAVTLRQSTPQSR